MRYCLNILLLLCATIVHSQQPAFYKFDNTQFTGTNIYDVIQDNDQNYWFATDKGLIEHDGYSYEPKTCSEMNGSSVFGFVKDSKGVVYCHNLHYQIFKIESGAFELYYEIPEELAFHEIFMKIDNQDNLLIQVLGLIQISKNKQSIKILKKELFPPDGRPANFHILPDGSTITSSTRNKIIHQKNGNFTLLETKNIDLNKTSEILESFKWITLNNQVFAITRNELEIYELDLNTFELEYVKTLDVNLSRQQLRIYHTEEELWITGISNGCYVFDKEFKPKYNGQLLYPNKFISDVFVDNEANILVSTFDEGIMVIPNNDVTGFELPNDEKISTISSDGDSTLFIGSNIGNFYSFIDGKLNLLFTDPLQKGNEGIYFWSKRNLVIHYTSEGAQISKWDGQQLTKIANCDGALKSVCANNQSELFLGMNFGLKKWQNEKNQKGEFISLSNFKKRIYGVDFDENTNSLYVATANGLVRETKNGDTSYLKYQGDVIYANVIKSVEGKIYVGSKKSGILVYENDKLIDQVKSDQSILQIEVYKGKVFYLTSKGLSIADLDSKTSFLLNNSTGLSCSNFSHFHINNNTLYVTDSKTLQYISIDKIFVQHEAKPVHFKHILVNDKPNSSTYLNANERKLEFVYGVNTLRYRDNINYRYKLDGFDKNWIYADYSENAIKYNALPSGEYEFQVQSLNGDKLSEIARYDFKIDSPFHQKWWFYLLIILCSVLILGIFFLQRLKKIRNKGKAKLQQQKNKTDMLESELRALRSQMNPHFIFNSLNSIQDLILKEDTDASYDYIVLFADLVRSTLNYSNKDFIPIDQEIEFLKVYLSLEKLRFKEDFEYEIIANIDNDIKVPSLLIQPFIENALLHGLIHKEGLKTLKITFELENKNLICRILDNGVGRKKAKEIQNRQVAHESFALQAIEKRLKILNEQNNMESGFEIIDLYVNDIAAGTEVVLNLPYRKLY